ncbi:hypothetical protein LLH23_21890 [bacterium]|nr:hypothetical protein [bacterium]
MAARAALALLLLCAAVPVRAADRPLSVLFLHGAVSSRPLGESNLFTRRGFLPDEKLLAQLEAAQITWGAESFSTQLSWDFLKQFNAIVMLDFPIVEKHADLKAAIAEKEQLLARFVAEGGGLMLTGNTEYGMWALERDFEEMDRFLKPYGAQVLHEQVAENSPALVLPTMGISALGWTGNVVKHPLTEGVRGLLYPTDHAWSYWTHPLQVGPGWEVLVKGSPSASTFTQPLGGATSAVEAPKTAGTYQSEPPLVAVRNLRVRANVPDAPKGRLALWPTVPSAFIIDGYHAFWGGGIIMDGTKADRPSDASRLLLSLIRWLGEPSAATFGGYQPPPEKGVGDEPGMQQVDWDKVKIEGKSQPHCWRGLIGMRSNLSDGAAAPSDMIAAARAAGYHFAAFTDDLDKLTADKLEAMKQACLGQSGPDFQAFPGFTYRDQSGNRWCVFGRQIHWPKDEWWSKSAQGAIGINNFIFRGFQFAPLIMLPGDAEPPWLQGNFKGIAVREYDAGKLRRDSQDVYMRLQKHGFDLFPVAVHRVGSPADIQAAAAAPLQTYVPWWELTDVISGLSGNVATYQGRYVFHRPSFVSGGPLIEDYRVYNFGSADLALPHNDRYRLHLQVSSQVGLREIALCDGPTLWRRVLLRGEKTWTGEFEGYQDRNRHFLALVTDTAGNQAISADRWTCIQDVGLVRCTDNLNTYTSGKFKAVNVFAPRGLESYIDQQAGSFVPFPFLGVPDTERPAVDQQITVNSRFGTVKDDVIEHHYAATASANWNRTDAPECAEPQTTIRGRTRTTMFANRADGPSVYLVEGDYRLLRDMDLPRGNIPIYRAPWLTDADGLYVSRVNAPGWAGKLNARRSHVFGPLEGLEYVAQFAPLGGSRALIPLQPGLSYEGIFNGERCYLAANLDVPAKKLTRGQPVQYRYAAVWDTVGGKPDTSFVEDVYQALGLRGKPAYTVKPTHGQVLDTKLALRLQAEGGGFAGTITQARLPLDLPVYITGLNDRWPAGILYKGKHALYLPVWKMNRAGDRWSVREQRTLDNELRRFPVLDGVGLLQVDTELGDRDLYVGNLLVCDQPEVFLELEDARPGKQVIMVNNPTDRDLTVTVQAGPGFDLLAGLRKTLAVKAGEVVRFARQ